MSDIFSQFWERFKSKPEAEIFPRGLNNIILFNSQYMDTDWNSNENEVIKKLQNRKEGA